MRVHEQPFPRHQGWHVHPALPLRLGLGESDLELVLLGAVVGSQVGETIGLVGVLRQPAGPEVVDEGPVLGDVRRAVQDQVALATHAKPGPPMELGAP